MNLQNAYIAQEDRRFKSHTGVDWIATFRAGLALIKNRGEITQGGSTITQQVVKNTYLTQEQSFTRKIVEILLAPEIEKKYSKADIMEFYCNTNFYGNHCYGVEAASRYYFGKDASDLESYEAAVLVGISNSPTAYNPVRNPEASLKKRNDVLQSMLEVGYLTEDAYNSAISQPLSIVQEEGEGSNENYMSSYAIHCAALALMKLDNFQFQYIFKDKSVYRLLWNFFLPLLTGGILCFSLIWHQHYGLTSSIMLIFYGLSLVNCSKYTYSDIRYLGYAEILLGLIDSFVVTHALLFWVIGFGLLHIVAGIYFYYKVERQQD